MAAKLLILAALCAATAAFASVRGAAQQETLQKSDSQLDLTAVAAPVTLAEAEKKKVLAALVQAAGPFETLRKEWKTTTKAALDQLVAADKAASKAFSKVVSGLREALKQARDKVDAAEEAQKAAASTVTSMKSQQKLAVKKAATPALKKAATDTFEAQLAPAEAALKARNAELGDARRALKAAVANAEDIQSSRDKERAKSKEHINAANATYVAGKREWSVAGASIKKARAVLA